MRRLTVMALAAVLVGSSGGIALAATTPSTDIHGSYGPTRAHHGSRDTEALNLLEAHGFGDFKDFHPVGQNFQATATVKGKQVTVMVNPDARTVTVMK
jgi:hypothetical protein